MISAMLDTFMLIDSAVITAILLANNVPLQSEDVDNVYFCRGISISGVARFMLFTNNELFRRAAPLK